MYFASIFFSVKLSGAKFQAIMAAQNNIWASEVLKSYILKFHDNDYPGDKCTYHDKEIFTQLQESYGVCLLNFIGIGQCIDFCYSILKCDMTIDNDHPGDKCTYHDKEMFTQLQES